MTQMDRIALNIACVCFGAGWFFSSFLISAWDICYMARGLFRWVKALCFTRRCQTYEEYRAGEDLLDMLDMLGRKYKRFSGFTVVLPYRDAEGVWEESGS